MGAIKITGPALYLETHMCVCLFVCLCGGMYFCLCMFMREWLCVCDFIHVHLCVWFCLCVCVYVPVYMTMCDYDVCMDMYVHMCVGTTWSMVPQQSLILICFFIVVVLIGLVGYCCSGKLSHVDLNITDYLNWVTNDTPGICLSSPPQCWNYMRATPLSSILHACWELYLYINTLPIKLYSQPHVPLILFPW